jgi:hypothetical protein
LNHWQLESLAKLQKLATCITGPTTKVGNLHHITGWTTKVGNLHHITGWTTKVGNLHLDYKSWQLASLAGLQKLATGIIG